MISMMIFGSSDDDILYSDDYLESDEGEDVSKFSSNFANYRISKMGIAC